MLGRREHSAAELKTKLELRGFQAADIEAVLRRLEEEDLLNPQRLIEQVLASRTAKGFGPLKIREDLMRRGIDRDRIDAAISSLQGHWDRVLGRLYSKKYPDSGSCEEPERSRRARYLAQRGFTAEQVERFLRRLSDSGLS